MSAPDKPMSARAHALTAFAVVLIAWQLIVAIGWLILCALDWLFGSSAA